MGRKKTIMKQIFSRQVVAAGALAFVFTAIPSANHSWNNYHWARSTGTFTLLVGDNVDASWDPYLTEAIDDWNESVVIQLARTSGGTRPKSCRPTAGRVEACNARYGNTGWLGIAQIWVTGGSHISQGLTKLNDTYFTTATYNTPAWRRLVTCQEIAHDFGLDHQDEEFDNANLGSCMDYTSDPDGGPGGAANNDPSNEHPDSHDFQQLVSIYNHRDNTSTATLPNFAEEGGDHPGQWGRLVHSNRNNRVQVYERDLGNGNRVITHVFWADPERDGRANHGH
jgi:hypothetical protein